MKRKRIIILGATGSIGRQTLDVVASYPERFELVGLSAHSDVTGLLAAAATFPAARLALGKSLSDQAEAKRRRPDLLIGPESVKELILGTGADMVVNGIAGSAGLEPSLDALESGKDLALANKESVVMAYALLEEAAAKTGTRILPVDSEHAALFQLLERVRDAEELTITASGVAFRDRPLAELGGLKPDQAAAHPSWKMGRKISIDSATMANKGLEVIEASRLFKFEAEKIRVLVHPQSLVHALVRGRDGSLYANISAPDMRLPILNALAYPEALSTAFGRLELSGRSLEFREADPERYPLLGLAYKALSSGYAATVAYNAADEVAVAAFESGEIGYLDIARVVERTLGLAWEAVLPNLEEVFAADRAARVAARTAIKELG
jgi:1-deoxy-D-xylulose-5-phosphate reductoisomerase